MIEIRNIAVQTKGFSLEDISLTAESGSCHVIIGPTGCGKTTLLEAVIGFRKIQKGSIVLDGRDITNLPVHERGFSYVAQDLAIFPHLTVEGNIFYGIRHSRNRGHKKRYEAAREIAASLGIAHLLKRKAVNLSGGERQRVAIARALAPGHRYLLLDEPLSSLHEGMKKEMWFLLRELQQKYGFTTLMVSHDMEETFFLANHISIMIGGRIRQTGEKDEIYHSPSTRDVAEYFGIKNIFRAEITGVDSDGVSVFCPELAATLTAPPDRLRIIEPGASVEIGIRAEEVLILGHDCREYAHDNILQGKIANVFGKGGSHTVFFSPEGALRTIEIEVPNYAFRKLDIQKTQDATVALRRKSLFFIGGMTATG
ncbi:MAG: ABC transporter ATP-binding protein [Nitrospirota bacterium]